MKRGSAGVLRVACWLLLFGVPLSTRAQVPAETPVLAGPEAAEAARLLFREGATLANAGRWEEARERFRRALALRASPMLRFNLAVAARNVGHFVEALDQYRAFLREDSDPANALRRREAQQAITVIEPVVAHVTPRVVLDTNNGDAGTTEGLRLWIDGRPMPIALLETSFPIDPGEHVFEVEGPQQTRAREVRFLDESEEARIELHLQNNTQDASVEVLTTVDASVQRDGASAPDASSHMRSSTIERVRRTLEERAAMTDAQGRRRWEQTLVLYGSQGTGFPVGIFGIGIRWAARPWFEFSADAGLGHPFGPGLGLSVAGRIPWNYQHASTLNLGLSTNFTVLPRGAERMGCVGPTDFTPIWFFAGIGNELRVTSSFALRAVVGARWLFNNPELASALRTHCIETHTVQHAGDVFFDAPSLDHTQTPVLPYMLFDAGWAF